MSALQAALDYARQGLRVHPCNPANKRPLTRWSQMATTHPGVVASFWRTWPDALVAVCTGDGLVVVDVDPRHGGVYDEDLARTRTATTPGGGWHHWFHWPFIGEHRIGNVVGLLPGVDLRGEGGYVIAPGSPGYEWANPHAEIMPLPYELVAAYRARKQRDRTSGGFEPAEAGSIGEGYRHDYMVRFAGWAIAVLEVTDLGTLQELCLEEYARACSPADAPAQNIRRIARSILQADARS